jgi:FecR protein
MRMRPLSIFGGAAAGMLICLGAIGSALAQDGSNPPDRVAQLSDAEGSVSLEPAGTASWTGAALNRPLTIGDKLWTDENSRAELDIGDAVIRLGSTTGFSFLNLDDQTAQMQVTAGTVIVHVRSLASGEQDEIDTPNLAVTLQQPGTYRVEVSDTGDTTIVKVDEGAALATGGGQSFAVASQQSVTFTGTSVLTADYATLGAPDDLDEWSLQRDQDEQQQAAVAQQYVAPDTVGGDDLGSYGTWEDTPDWGYAWFPAVAAGWAPYTLGNWVWISPWGWTWVDEEPWGFAPFHYGRWGYWQRRWCWIPEPRRKRPVYAPALVAWIGGRPRAGASVSIGARVGWLPLGPGDVYGVAHARYVNSEVPGAVTVVPRNVFTSAQPVAPHRVILPRQGGIGFRATTAAPAITPVRQSVLGANWRSGRAVRVPPPAIMNRPVVARLAPPRAPVSFAREQAAIRGNGGRPLPMADLARLRPNIPAAPVRLATPMSVRERMLQQQSLPPAGAPRSDRPSWAQGQPTQFGAWGQPRPETIAPQQRQPPLDWRLPPQRQASSEGQAPVQRFISPPPRPMPEQHFAPPERQIPAQRFAPPERQIPEPRFTPPPRQVVSPRFTPPAPRAAPARPSESRPPPRSTDSRTRR